jgi:Tol biopolymer transport system component
MEKPMFRKGQVKIFSLKEIPVEPLSSISWKNDWRHGVYATSWSPDGNNVIFTERDTSGSSFTRQKLYLINPDNGTLNPLGDAPEGYPLSELRWSPDGSKVVATGKSVNSARAPIYEYWVMENFLPK